MFGWLIKFICIVSVVGIVDLDCVRIQAIRQGNSLNTEHVLKLCVFDRATEGRTGIEEKCFVVDKGYYVLRDGDTIDGYTQELECRFLGHLLRYFQTTLKFLQVPGTARALMEPVTTACYRNRYLHLMENLETQLSLSDALKHVMFYDDSKMLNMLLEIGGLYGKMPQTIIDRINGVFSKGERLSVIQAFIYDEVEWSSKLTQPMIDYIARKRVASAEDKATMQAAENFSGSGRSLMSQNPSYDTTKLSELFRIIANIRRHPESVSSYELRELGGDIKNDSLYLKYWTDCFPALLTVVWHFAIRERWLSAAYESFLSASEMKIPMNLEQ